MIKLYVKIYSTFFFAVGRLQRIKRQFADPCLYSHCIATNAITSNQQEPRAGNCLRQAGYIDSILN